MNYFVVNNDFHLEHLDLFCEKNKIKDVVIILIPFSIKSSPPIDLYSNIYMYSSLLKESGVLKKILLNLRTRLKINSEIKIKDRDSLYVFTEYEPFNQLFIEIAKNTGAKTILLEEGIATYYTCIKHNRQVIGCRDRLKVFFYKFILGFSNIELLKLGNNDYFQIKDSFFTEIILYTDVELNRKIEKKIFPSPYNRVMFLKENLAVFLNQPIYESFLSFEDYKKELVKVISKILQDNTLVYFRFHPRELGLVKKEIKLLFYANTSVVFENDEKILSRFLKDKMAKNIYSFFSDALLKLKLQGFTVHYMFGNVEQLSNNPVLKNVTKFIENAGWTDDIKL